MLRHERVVLIVECVALRCAWSAVCRACVTRCSPTSTQRCVGRADGIGGNGGGTSGAACGSGGGAGGTPGGVCCAGACGWSGAVCCAADGDATIPNRRAA